MAERYHIAVEQEKDKKEAREGRKRKNGGGRTSSSNNASDKKQKIKHSVDAVLYATDESACAV